MRKTSKNECIPGSSSGSLSNDTSMIQSVIAVVNQVKTLLVWFGFVLVFCSVFVRHLMLSVSVWFLRGEKEKWNHNYYSSTSALQHSLDKIPSPFTDSCLIETFHSSGSDFTAFSLQFLSLSISLCHGFYPTATELSKSKPWPQSWKQ